MTRRKALPIASLAHRALALAALALLVAAAPARALQLTGGPSSTLPDGSSCASQDAAPDGTAVTFACVVMAPERYTDIYFGLANNATPNGMEMDGSLPSGREIFRYSSSTPQSITYTSSTSIENQVSGATQNVNSRLVLTLTDGDGTVIDTGGAPADGDQGDIQKLFRVTGTTFSVRVEVTSNTLTIPTFGPSNDHVFNAINSPETGSTTSVQLGFYYLACQ